MRFAPGLLDGRRIAYFGADGDATAAGLRELGATVASMPSGPTDEEALEAWVAANLPLHGLVLDAGRASGGNGTEMLTAALEQAWVAVRAVATGALIPAQRGRLILIAPRPDAGPYAHAARAGLENLARTLSVEWARFTVTAVAITPARATRDQELTDLVSFLLSEAGGYFTGCRFDLDGVVAPSFISAS